MGALHDGHRSLIRLAKTRGDVVVVSIFVNPLQFGPGEDYARYPRPLEDDLQICEADGVDIVFVPTVSDLYPAGRQVTVHAGDLGSMLEGNSRPGHFDGVLTVVLKLFNIVRPQVAVFGEKDAQQLACIQRMVIDLNLAVEIVGAPDRPRARRAGIVQPQHLPLRQRTCRGAKSFGGAGEGGNPRLGPRSPSGGVRGLGSGRGGAVL